MCHHASDEYPSLACLQTRGLTAGSWHQRQHRQPQPSSAGDDVLYGSDYADSLDGGANNNVLLAFYSVNGVDTLVGGTGADRFAYTTTGNMGADRITDFDADAAGGQDLIDLTGLGYSFGSNMTVTASGANTLVTFAGGSLASTTLTLTGVAVANVTAVDFVF